MNDMEKLQSNIQKTLFKNFLSKEISIDETMKKKIKDDFKITCNEDFSISFSLSTKYFPRPIRISFIRRRIEEILLNTDLRFCN